MGVIINKFTGKFNEFRALAPGERFSVRVTDTEAADAAREYLTKNRSHVSEMIRSAAGVGLDVSDPEVRFHPDEVFISARGGKGFMKVKASLCAEIRWDGRPLVNVRSVEVPFVPVTPQKLNSVVEKPLVSIMKTVGDYAEIISFRIAEGEAVLDALRK